MRRSLFTLLATAAISSAAVLAPSLITPASAQINLNIDIGTPPPPMRYEMVPAPRPGYAWAPGGWQWEQNRHVWREGHWMEARRGEHWVPDRWEKHNDNGREQWRHESGRWDRDHDGRPDGRRGDLRWDRH